MGNSIDANDRLRIIVTGYILRWPLGGNAWPYLQYVLGLSQLGHEVYYLEESGDSPYCCYDAETGDNSTDPGYGLRFTAAAFDSVGLGDNWGYYDVHTARWLGPCADRVDRLCATADVLLRLPAMADSLRPWLEAIPVRALIDTDPVFTQLRHLRDPLANRDAQRYNAFFSFGENIPRGTSKVPDDGLPWVATRQPMVLDAWPFSVGPPEGRFTTVMKWESYRQIEFEGVGYGMKAASFGPYMDLPQRVGAELELSVGGDDTPVDTLTAHGWRLSNPLEVTRDMWTYQRYIQASKAEFSVAKQGYVVSRSGWLSERTGGYLASGRPALVQETGFSDWLRADGGLLAFSTPEEAAARIDDICSRYRFHCQAAREIAEEYFDARKVLPRLLEDAYRQAHAGGRRDVPTSASERQTQGSTARLDDTPLRPGTA